jgi:uncharacterized protein (TIGR02421 family)
MRKETARKLLALVSGALGSLRSSANLLEEIGWSRAVEERFFAGRAARLPKVAYTFDRPALEQEAKGLARVARKIKGDGAIPTWLRAVVNSAIDRNRLLLAAGTREFGRLSREIYGGASSTFYGMKLRNIDLAEHVLARMRPHGTDEAKERAEEPLAADELAAELTRRIAKHRPKLDVAVVVDDRCAAKVIAGAKRVRVRAGATFQPWEADGLFCHEVETHIFTAQNGAAQPLAPFLRSGGPRSTPSQEGLAVFAELYNRALAVPRLERLAIRVKLVQMSEDGASFLDLYRFLLDRGQDPRGAYLDASRVCRGGMVEGGSPFTKDSCYLAGLLHVYAFLAAFVRGGFRDETEMIVAGRIALDDVAALVALRRMDLLERPRHLPRWLARWSTLLPYFGFASFMDGVDLAPVEAHYKHLIDLARAD